MLNSPSPLETALSFMPLSEFVAVTVAPGITAPVGSVTAPMIDPVSACANKRGPIANSVRAIIASHKPRIRFRPPGSNLFLFNITKSSKVVNQRWLLSGFVAAIDLRSSPPPLHNRSTAARSHLEQRSGDSIPPVPTRNRSLACLRRVRGDASKWTMVNSQTANSGSIHGYRLNFAFTACCPKTSPHVSPAFLLLG